MASTISIPMYCVDEFVLYFFNNIKDISTIMCCNYQGVKCKYIFLNGFFGWLCAPQFEYLSFVVSKHLSNTTAHSSTEICVSPFLPRRSVSFTLLTSMLSRPDSEMWLYLGKWLTLPVRWDGPFSSVWYTYFLSSTRILLWISLSGCRRIIVSSLFFTEHSISD